MKTSNFLRKNFIISKKRGKKFRSSSYFRYLCKRYPEYNLFTLKKLIPIECRAVACEGSRSLLFYNLAYTDHLFYQTTNNKPSIISLSKK